MKKLFFLFLLILSSGLKAQLPHYIHFQAAIRNASGAVLPNQLISLKVELSQGALTYYEIHNITTNDLGLINIDIGGQPASGSIPFSAVDWASGGINLNTWFDPTGSSSNWQWISSSTLASVPYALHALNAFSGDFADLQNVPPLDTSSTNEIQNLSFLNDTLYISSSSGIYLPLSLKAEEIDDLTDGFTSGKSLGLGDGALLGPSYQGINNTAIGYKALESSVGGNNNTALGSEAMKANISGSQNTAIGQTALFSNTTGDHNTAVGTGALYGNTSGQGNLAMGLGALHLNASGNYNIAIGHQAMLNNDAGSDNVAIGRNALQNNVLAPSGIGSVNVSIGLNSLRYAVSNGNVAVGGDGLHHLTTGQFNTALGTHAMRDAKTGSRNVAIGYASMMQTDTAVTYNTAIGSGSGENSSGSYNIYLGHWSGRYNSGNNNILIGNGAGNHTTLQNQSNILVIENSPAADPLIFGDFNANTVEINDNLKVASKVGIGVASPQRTLHISDVMRIEPSASAPTNPSEGDMYMDSTTHKLMVFDGTNWQACW